MKLEQQIKQHIIDLYWEYDRMSISGKKSIDKPAKLFDVPQDDKREILDWRNS